MVTVVGRSFSTTSTLVITASLQEHVVDICEERRSIPCVTLRVVESKFGAILVDDDPATAPSRLELLALELDIDPDALRERLRGEVQERLRARGLAWEKLDTRLEKRANGSIRSLSCPDD